MGYWIDLEHPYITFENSYIESVWWILKQFFERGLLYEGFKILPYCPRCETPLSSHEVSLGYRTDKDPSVYVRMALADEPETSFLVWTTTPWTLISNVALAVHPQVEYVKVEYEGQKLILAEARLEAVLHSDYKILQRFPGRDLQGKRYQRLFDDVPVDKDAFYVVLADYVTTEDGTGIVHTAPAFGDDDYKVGQKYNLPVIRPVDKSGRFEAVVKDYAGMFVKDADAQIISDLKKSGRLFRKETIEHSYPHCWRCDSPLLYYARESWYIKTSEFKERMLANNAQINWHPPEVGAGRFGEWLKNNVDWALSRNRYWGTPLNIWKCGDCDRVFSIGSVEELRRRGREVPENIDLHKPYVDAIKIPCESCGAAMERVPEVIDCWFDSGSMPYAQWHYPFENKDVFEKNFPADFICEGIDQTRGWFYSLLAISTLLFNKPAYKNIVVNELILDRDGQKMSKTRGNVVRPEAVIETYGVDPLRWYFISSSAPWAPKKFDVKGIEEGYRKFFDTLFNTYNFFAMYANIDKFDPQSAPVAIADRPEIDRWVLSALYSTVIEVRDMMDGYDLTRAARKISSFLLDDVSNWYVRRNRRRFWKSEMGADKLAAYQTLYEVLLSVTKLIAPFMPFVADDLYRRLRTKDMPESVHLTDFPAVDAEKENARDEALEETMRTAQTVVALARAMRNAVRIKVRQPLKEIVVASQKTSVLQAVEKMADIIREEINVKAVKTTPVIAELVNRRAKPNFKALGPRLGKLMNPVARAIQKWDETAIAELEEKGQVTIHVDGKAVDISLDEVELFEEQSGNFYVGREANLVVGLDTELTPELEMEGIARDFVNRIQNLRKERDLQVTDRVRIFYDGPEHIRKAIEAMSDYIMTETLAIDLRRGVNSGENVKQIEIGSESFPVLIEKSGA